MREHILNTWPWITVTWKYTRGALTLFGATCLYLGMFYYGVAIEVITSALFITSLAVTFILEGLLLGFTVKALIMNLPSGGGYYSPKSGLGEFDIKDDGNVIYDSGTTLAELKKSKFTADTWKSLAKKYQGKDYRGKGWELVRLHCLTQAKKAPSFEINGNQVTF